MSIQGDILDITVNSCSNLRDTEWLSRQDPYVVLEYAGRKYRTRTDTDGGRNPRFNEKYVLQLVEGLREINVYVWNSNTLTTDDFIGSGKILLQKVLSEGYDDSSWPLTRESGRRGGEVRVLMHYKRQRQDMGYYNACTIPQNPYGPPAAPYPTPYAAPYGPPLAAPYGPPPAAPYGPPPAAPYGPPLAAPYGPPTYPAPSYPPQAYAPPYPPPPSGYPPYQGGYWPR